MVFYSIRIKFSLVFCVTIFMLLENKKLQFLSKIDENATAENYLDFFTPSKIKQNCRLASQPFEPAPSCGSSRNNQIQKGFFKK